MPTAEYEPRLPTYRDVLRAYDRAWTTWQDDPSPRSFAVLQTGIEILYRELAKPGTFELGQVVMTPGASEALLTAQQASPEFLLRHKHGDWLRCVTRCMDRSRREPEQEGTSGVTQLT